MNSNPAIALKFSNDPENASATPTPVQAPRFDQLYGSVRIVATEPAWTPRGRIEDSIALLIDAGTPNLCVYDYQNDAWLFAELSATRIP